MKKTILKISSKILMICMFCVSVCMTSCIPEGGSLVGGSGGNNSGEEEKPVLKDPEGTKIIGLYAENPDNLAGLYFHKDGYLTSNNGWKLSHVATTNCLAYVDYIPRNNWSELLFITYGDGFVGYKENEGFVRFYVSGVALNNGIIGVQLKYHPNFYGKDEAPELSKTSLSFGEDGGDESIAITSKTYTVFQSMSKDRWCKVTQTGSVYPYIIDGIDIEVEPNESSEPRQTEILLTTHDGKTSVVNVSQEGKYIEQ